MRHWLVGLLVCVGSTGTSSTAQSLGDLAKKEADRRQTVSPAKKVFTDEDIKRRERETPVVADTQAGEPNAVSNTEGTSGLAAGDLAQMRVKAEALLGPPLERLNAEGKQKNDQYRSVAAQARGACSGSTRSRSAGVSSTFLGYNPLIMVNRDGTTRVEPNPIFVTTGTVSVTAVDNSSTPVCRALMAQARELSGWAKEAERRLDAMEIAAKREGIYPGVVRSLFAARLKSW